jgi:glycosyltransferase involved in cell wall biosynthesis
MYTVQTLAALERVRPDWQCTVVTLAVEPDAKLPATCAVQCRRSKLLLCISGVLTTLKRRPREVLVFQVHLIPLAWVCATLVGARLTLFTYGWEVSRNNNLLERYLSGKASRLVAISRTTALAVERFLPPWKRHRKLVELLPPTFDEEKYYLDADTGATFRKHLHLDPAETVLLTVGRLDPSERCKGHEQVIRSLPRLLTTHPRIKYLIVGQGCDQARLQTIVAELGLKDIVRFLGFVADLRGCYSASDLFVMPSIQEGFGIVFSEALACGVPVVAGGLDGSVTPLSWGLSGFLCDPYSAASLEEAITAALESRASGDKRSDPAYLAARVRQNFGSSSFDRRLDTILRGASARGAGSPFAVGG